MPLVAKCWWNEAGEMEWKLAGLGMRLNKRVRLHKLVTYVLVLPH